ncbi:hypothetical protein AB0O00_19475, partial [Kitasatospora sp. NPDC093558]
MTVLSTIARRDATLQRDVGARVDLYGGPVTICLPYWPESVGQARRLVRETLTGWGLPQLIDAAAGVPPRRGCHAPENR